MSAECDKPQMWTNMAVISQLYKRASATPTKLGQTHAHKHTHIYRYTYITNYMPT